RRGVGEVSEGPGAGGHDVRLATAVRPGRRPEQRHDRLDAARVKTLEDRIHAAPLVRGVVRGKGARGSRGRDLVPADAEANRRHAEALEEVETRLERARPAEQPGVVLDAVLDTVRRACRGGEERRPGECDGDDEGEARHSAEATREICFENARKSKRRVRYRAGRRARGAGGPPRARRRRALRRFTSGAYSTAAYH